MFKVNHDYNREALLSFVGSKQNQSGIIWGVEEPGCVIVTSGGRHGKMVGYGDRLNQDGSWSYVGQGSKGDQDPDTFANSLLVEGRRAILLFSTREPNAEEVRERGHYRKLYRFEGICKVASWDFLQPNSGKRKGDKLIVFTLIPAENIYDIANDVQFVEIGPSSKQSLERLKELRIKLPRNQSELRAPKGKLNYMEYRLRSQLVKKYALVRAQGKCENCLKDAPFFASSGVPFLEVHHIFSLADDGPDIVENVAAICPNCHREAHFGIGRLELNSNLYFKICEKEKLLSSEAAPSL